MTAWLRQLLYVNVMASVLIALVCVLRRVGRRALGSRFLYGCWLLVALRLLFPVTIPMPMPDAIARPLGALSAQVLSEAPAAPASQASQASRTTQVQQASHTTQTPHTPTNAGPAPASLPPASVLGMVWLAGALAIGTGMALRNARFRKSLHMRALTEEEAAGLAASMARHGLRLPRARVSARIQSPCLVGGLRPWLVIPQDMPPDEEATAYALRHEACHVRAGDPRWALLRAALCCLHWFNPAVWLAARLSAADAEFACDMRVMATLDEKNRYQYARTLVNAAQRQTISMRGLSFSGGRLRARVTQILEGSKMKKTWILLMAALMVVAFGVSFAVSETEQTTPYDDSVWREWKNPDWYTPEWYITAGIREGAKFYQPTGKGSSYRAVRISTMDIVPEEVIVTRIMPGSGSQSSVCYAVVNGVQGRMYLKDLIIDPQTLAGKEGAIYADEGQELAVYEKPDVGSRVAMVLHGDYAKVEIDEYGDDWCRVKLGRNAGYVPTSHVGVICMETPDDLYWFWDPS